MCRLGLAAFAAIVICSSASAAVLTEVAPGTGADARTLFTSEWKRDQNVHNPGRNGHDIFLRNGSGFGGPSIQQGWGASGAVYAWSLSYDGDQATLIFDGVSRTIDLAPDGVWNAVQFYMRANDFSRFETSTTTLRVSKVNDLAVSGFERAATDSAKDAIFALADSSEIRSMSGTLAFDFVVKDGAKGSPNSRYRVSVAAREIVPVPLPAALPLLILAIGGLSSIALRLPRKNA